MKALIISLNFNPGHVSHMVASYKQCEELGYESYYYANPQFEDYLPSGSRILLNGYDNCPMAELAIFLFPSQKNLPLILRLKNRGTKITYIFHEPLAPLKEYRNAGFSYKYLAKLWIIDHISALTVKWSDIILLPSKKALSYYMENTLYKNHNYYYLPLMYDDETTEKHAELPRRYFSYIGTVAADHSFNEYLDFICWVIKENKYININFLIASKSEFELPDILKKSSRVTILKGKPMTNEEINTYYASSFCIWNAYARTTQSGVLAKSFMFGTPAIVLRKNINEFAQDRVEVLAIDDNNNKEEIASAVNEIYHNFDEYSQNCRNRFLNSFYYRNYNKEFEKMIK